MNSNGNLREFGKSGIMITPIGLGCWQFSKKNGFAGRYWPYLEDDEIQAIVDRSLDAGINWFDTAELYGNGASEKSLSKSLKHRGIKPGEVVIETKWWPLLRTAGNIGLSIHKRLEALDPFPIDIYLVHQPYGFSGVREEMNAMAKLVRSGKIRHVGVSNFSAKQMRSAWEILDKSGIPLLTNQVRYNLLDRHIESDGALQTAKELGITLVAYSPLAQGLATGKFHENPEIIKNTGYRRYMPPFSASNLEKSRPLVKLVREMAEKYNTTPSQVALSWIINFHGNHILAIPGATKEKYAIENAGAMNLKLSSEDMSLLDRASAIFR